MGGRASLIMVIGFAVIFAYINFNLARLTNTASEGMIGYNQIAQSRNMANAGANIGLAMLSYKNYPHVNRKLSTKKYTTGEYAGCGYSVNMDSVGGSEPYLRLRSVSTCTTYYFTNKARTIPFILQDTVEVRYDCFSKHSFSSLGWMTDNEGNVFFTTGDTLWGKIHSNGNIHVDGSPVFWDKVSTSGKIDPSTKGKDPKIFKVFPPAQGVEEKQFPDDFSELQATATNAAATQTLPLFVQLYPGASADNDGYAIISTGNFIGGSGTPVKVDSIKLSDVTNNVIYSSQAISVKGKLDGRLSIASHTDLTIAGNTTYEKPPNVNKPWNDPSNSTKDMLGLVAWNDIVIPDSYTAGSIAINGALFAKEGSFRADKYNESHGGEWRINLIGSITQKDRGAVGQTNGNGYKKSYRYDPRFANDQDSDYFPPAFPSYTLIGPPTITSWWESTRVPLDVTNLY
jgi:hypothetical protein